MKNKKLIASTTNKKYGDVFIGFADRDESFVEQGHYKFNNGEPIDLPEEVENQYPKGCTAVHFANDDVKKLFPIW